MHKLLVVISGFILTGAVGMTNIINSNHMAYSSPPQISVSPTPTITPTIVPTIITSLPTPITYQDNLEVMPVTVKNVLDIETIQVEYNDTPLNIHIIGIAAPTKEQQQNYLILNQEKVLIAMQNMLIGKTVFLVTNNTIIDKPDQKSRSRYVFLEDMTFLNTELIKQGLAIVDYEEDLAIYKSAFEKVEMEAKTAQAGIWYSPTATPSPIKKPTTTTVPLKTLSGNIATPITLPITKKLPTEKPPSPTKTPTPTRTAYVVSDEKVTPPAKSLNPDIILSLINEHRKSKNLFSLEKNDELCSIAQSRAPELYDEIFVTHNVHAGLYSRNIPYWLTENMAHYPSEEKIVQWWLNSYIHRSAIEGDHKYTCGACYGNSCTQLFTSFVMK